MRYLLLLWLALSLAALADPVEIHFETVPAGVSVLLETSQGEVALARRATAVEVDPSLFSQAELTFRLLKNGYETLEVRIPRQRLVGSPFRWPEDPSRYLRLQPQLVQATFHTTPPGAAVWAIRAGQSDEYLGRADQTLSLSLAQLLGDTEAGFFQVEFRLDGYHPETVPISNHFFGPGQSNRWPQEGAYALRPAGAWPVRAWSWVQQNPALATAAAVLGLVLVSVAWPLAARLRIRLARARVLEDARASESASLVGRKLGPYRLIAPLGAGGMASVYQGVPDEAFSGEPCAIKVLNYGQDHEAFKREANLLRQLQHPNIVRLDDWGEQNGLYYLVTELVLGSTMEDEILTVVPPERMLALMLPVLEAVDYAHRRGIVHCDLKPANVLVDRRGTPKVADFGIARLIGQQPDHESRLLGTPGYLAPERFSGRPATAASDQYALGVMLFRGMAGRLPFPVEPGALLSPDQVGGRAPSCEDLPAEVRAVVAKMLAPKPEHRFASVGEALIALSSEPSLLSQP
ncbi:MAG: serine/threonine protein kinase [Candidatus Eremiobacteraeota bacterium]|nr:serine/threonine protein kinase [Candidatus Eremiobacteraeota bacterium]